MEWFGQARISFTHADSPLILRKKDGTVTDLLRVCEESTPPCQLNPALFNGHLQTMWTLAQTDAPPVYYRRKIFEASLQAYRGSFAVDFAVGEHGDIDETLPPRTAYFSDVDFSGIASEDNRPMLIVLHGLSGGSHEVYLRHAIAPLVPNNGGWEVCVVNSRGCANSRITSGILFNARATWDIRQVLKAMFYPSTAWTQPPGLIEVVVCELGSRHIPESTPLRTGLLPGGQYFDKRVYKYEPPKRTLLT